ncbi:hypothetical protein N780_01695 [Pontibacillus chungwhensis BH030062]|uniref:Uncharacterized protein n=2 Tax=Pontibacillus chungwhensis TaxID=265426 RepID=A0A0A2V061_9BACI|nr:hypothetical protein N780_01695 [Pontibacillus chungwhensis BH030062]
MEREISESWWTARVGGGGMAQTGAQWLKLGRGGSSEGRTAQVTPLMAQVGGEPAQVKKNSAQEAKKTAQVRA